MVNLYVTSWFCFCFDFVRSHARCSYCSMVYLRFQAMQIKQVDYNMSTKNVNKLCKATKKQIVRLQLNEKKSKESQTRLMS